VPDEPKIGVGQEFAPGIWPSPQTLSSAVPLFILAYQVLKFPCHFVAHKVSKIQGFVAGLGAVLQIRCADKFLKNQKSMLQL